MSNSRGLRFGPIWWFTLTPHSELPTQATADVDNAPEQSVFLVRRRFDRLEFDIARFCWNGRKLYFVIAYKCSIGCAYHVVGKFE